MRAVEAVCFTPEPGQCVGKVLAAVKKDGSRRYKSARRLWERKRIIGPAQSRAVLIGEVADQSSRDVVDAIAAVPVGAQDRPKENVVINSVTIDRS